MRRPLPVLLCLLLIFACSDDTTAPVDDDGSNEPESFSVNWTAENDRAGSATITAAAGGTVEATGSDGVTYRLGIPAGALAADTTVTIVPVSGLAVEGPGSFICAASCGGTDCCVAGALFEPEGLEFDSLATLEIVFPAAAPFPFDSTGGIFLFDSPHAEMGVCETGIDFAAKTLTAGIWHFSGYGTGAAECARLNALYVMMQANAEANVGMDGFFYCLSDLINIVSWNKACDPAGIAGCRELCEGLDDMVINEARSALALHLAALLANHPASTATQGDVEHLIGELERSRRIAGVEAFRDDMRSFEFQVLIRITGMAQAIAAEGQSLCGSGECGEGQSLLAYVISLGDRGYVTDAAFLASVRSWYEDCCGFWRLAMSVDRTEIQRAAINEGDEDLCVCTVTLRLTTSSGQPVEGVFLDVDWDGATNLAGGDSDANGEHSVSLTSLDLGYGERFYCNETVTKTLTSSVYNSEAGEWTEADPIVITFRNFSVSTGITYTYTAVEYEDSSSYGTTACTIDGGGSSYANTTGSCETHCSGVITRSYDFSGCMRGDCGTTTIIEGAETPGCLIRPNIDYYDRGDGVRIPVLLGLNFFPASITDGVKIQSCDAEECIEYWKNLADWIPWPGYGGIPEYWENTSGGQFEPYTWTFSETSEIGSKEASLSITVEAAP